MPISSIKVGDFVLSHSENPSARTERDYKRVNRTFSFEDQPILQFCWCRNFGDGEFDHAFATANPLVWSYPQGWLPIGNVPYSSSGGEEWFGRNLLMADGSVGERYEINGVYVTQNKKVAYVHCDGFGSGNYVDLSSSPHRFLKNDEESQYESGREDQDSDDWLAYATRVYHIEVEGWHTFFVGKTGLLVHDSSQRPTTTVPLHLVDLDPVR